MADMKRGSTAGGIATILIAVVVIWLGLKLIGVAFKLVGLLILGGLAVGAYLFVTGRLGGPDRRA